MPWWKRPGTRGERATVRTGRVRWVACGRVENLRDAPGPKVEGVAARLGNTGVRNPERPRLLAQAVESVEQQPGLWKVSRRLPGET